MRHSTALPIAWVFLRILLLLNWLSGAAILALLIATVVAQDWTFRALGITPESGIPGQIIGLQGVAALGVVAVVVNHGILRRLLDMVVAPTLVVATDDPFLPPAFLRQAVVQPIRGARMTHLPGPGHYPQVERPHETAALVGAFLAGSAR